MFEAAICECPFVEGLPKREKSKLARAWELVATVNAVAKAEGYPYPLMLAAKCLGVSRTRIDELVGEGRLKRVEIDGHVFITENSLVEFAKRERKNGRPVAAEIAVDKGAKAVWQMSRSR